MDERVSIFREDIVEHLNQLSIRHLFQDLIKVFFVALNVHLIEPCCHHGVESLDQIRIFVVVHCEIHLSSFYATKIEVNKHFCAPFFVEFQQPLCRFIFFELASSLIVKVFIQVFKWVLDYYICFKFFC